MPKGDFIPGELESSKFAALRYPYSQMLETINGLGVNATLRNALIIGEGSFFAMVAVMKDTEPWSVYKGNPVEKLSMPNIKMCF